MGKEATDNKIIFTVYDIEGRYDFYKESKKQITAYLQQTYLAQDKEVPKVELQLIGDLTDKGKGNIALVEQIAKDLNELNLCDGQVTAKVKVFTGNREGTKLRLKDELRLCNVDKVVALEAELTAEELALGQKERLELNKKNVFSISENDAPDYKNLALAGLSDVTLDGLPWSDGKNGSFLQFLYVTLQLGENNGKVDDCITTDQRDAAKGEYDKLADDVKLNLYMRYLFAKTMGAPNFLKDVAAESSIEITNKNATDEAWTTLQQKVMENFATATKENAYYSIQKNLLVADYDRSTKTLTSHSGPGENLTESYLNGSYAINILLKDYFESCKPLEGIEGTLHEKYKNQQNHLYGTLEYSISSYNIAHQLLMHNLEFLYAEMDNEEEAYQQWKQKEENKTKSAAEFTHKREKVVAKKYALLKQLHEQFVLLGLPPHVHNHRSTINHNQVGKDDSFGHEPYSFNTNFGHKPAGFPRSSAHVDDEGKTHYCTNGDSTNYKDTYRFLVTEYNAAKKITERKFVYQPDGQEQQILQLPAQHESGKLYRKNKGKAGGYILLAENEPFRYSGFCLRDFLQTGLFVDNNHKTINFNDEHVKQLLSCNVIVSEDNKSARVVRQDSTPPFASIALNIDLTGPARQSATAFLQEVSNRYKAFYAEKLPRKKLVGEGEETAEAQQKREEKNESIKQQFLGMGALQLDILRDKNYNLNSMLSHLFQCTKMEAFSDLYQQLYAIEAARKNMRPDDAVVKENEMPSAKQRLEAMVLGEHQPADEKKRKQKAAVIIQTEIAACQTAAEVVALYNILRDSKYDFLRLKRNSLPSLHAETRTWSVDILTALKKRYVSLQLDAQKQQDIPLQESTSKQNLSSASQENTSNNSEHSIEHQEKLGTGESISLHEFPAADKTSRKNVMYNAEDLLTEKRYWNVFKNKANGFQDLLTRVEKTDHTASSRENTRKTVLLKK